MIGQALVLRQSEGRKGHTEHESDLLHKLSSTFDANTPVVFHSENHIISEAGAFKLGQALESREGGLEAHEVKLLDRLLQVSGRRGVADDRGIITKVVAAQLEESLKARKGASKGLVHREKKLMGQWFTLAGGKCLIRCGHEDFRCVQRWFFQARSVNVSGTSSCAIYSWLGSIKTVH